MLSLPISTQKTSSKQFCSFVFLQRHSALTILKSSGNKPGTAQFAAVSKKCSGPIAKRPIKSVNACD